jgi:hypothetical protein
MNVFLPQALEEPSCRLKLRSLLKTLVDTGNDRRACDVEVGAASELAGQQGVRDGDFDRPLFAAALGVIWPRKYLVAESARTSAEPRRKGQTALQSTAYAGISMWSMPG